MALSTDNWINLISGLGGAVIGGCLGGAISFFLARQASRETLKRDAATRLTDLRMAALTFVTKLIQLANGLYTLSSTIEGSIDAARKEGNDGMLLWQKVKPRLGSITPPHFEALDFRAFSGIASGSMILNQTLLLE